MAGTFPVGLVLEKFTILRTMQHAAAGARDSARTPRGRALQSCRKFVSRAVARSNPVVTTITTGNPQTDPIAYPMHFPESPPNQIANVQKNCGHRIIFSSQK